MEKDVKESLEIVSAVLDLLNSKLEELDERVSILEVTDKIDNILNDNFDDNYITIKIHKNATNFDVLRKIFGCKVLDDNHNNTLLDIDDVTSFKTAWLKTRYRGCVNNETD